MSTSDYRVEHDSMGALDVPVTALWGAQTQRAIQNFPPSGLRMPRAFIRALGLIKAAAAAANRELGAMPADLAEAIRVAAADVARGDYDDQFPVDVFQTGSGTSSNMNANEVIAALASRGLGRAVHANDHVNMSQSSNDVVPTAIHVAAALLLCENLLPALRALSGALETRMREFGRPLTQDRAQALERRQQLFVEEERCGDVNRRGHHIVAALAHVHVIVRMHGAGQRTRGERRDYFVRIHVAAGARPGLKDVHRELVVIPARGDLEGRCLNGRCQVSGQIADLRVGDGRGMLDEPQGANERPRHAQPRSRKVLHGALGLGAPQSARRYFQRAHAVVLDASGCRHRSLTSL